MVVAAVALHTIWVYIYVYICHQYKYIYICIHKYNEIGDEMQHINKINDEK